MQYYGTRLSENISRRQPEGYLLCLNVPVARTGTQEYLLSELGLPSGPGGLISVYRPEEEVFSPETIASFEGMPVTNDHPPEGVDLGNIRALQKGHAHNVRRGTGDESDLLLADLIITDERLIDLILSGKREISCGYTYELAEENGQYIQRKIRGNHVAVVDAGRAGPRVCIKDHKTTEPERSTHPMKKSLSRILARMAKDGDIETVAEIIEEMIEPESAAEQAAEAAAEAIAETAPAEDPAVVVETPETTVVVDEATLGEVLSRLDQIISLLTPAAPAEDDDPAEEIAEVVEEAAEAIEEAVEAAAAAEEAALPDESAGVSAEEISQIVGEILEPAVSEVIGETEDECGEEDPEVIPAGDALRAALHKVAPALAKLPRKHRLQVAADIAARLHGDSGRRGADTGIYAALASRQRRPAKNPLDLGKRIMASRNPNYHKAG